ncbi:MAG: N-acetyltransferase family protein [Candidatus Hermodarchaeia archaeon]|jgi:ribosomal protein S18 acetylase RimI-like enzyme
MPIEYEPCSLCDSPAEYSCSECGEQVCANNVRIRVVCTKCSSPKECKYTLHQAFSKDIEQLERLVTLFWGDPVQQMFDQQFKVTEQPAIVAESDDKIVGFLFYTPFHEDEILIVACGVLPRYQGCGIGKALITQIEKVAFEQGRERLLVVTTNDNLPALAFYQQIGFQLFEVVPNIVAKKLGGTLLGVANIPIRDELRMQKHLS